MLKKLTNLTCTLGEGPVWDSQKNKLWWVDIKQKKILALLGTNEVEVINCPGQVGCLGLLDENHLIVAEETGILGCSLLLLAFTILISRIFSIGKRCLQNKRDFSGLACYYIGICFRRRY